MSQRCLCAWLWYRIFLSCDVHIVIHPLETLRCSAYKGWFMLYSLNLWQSVHFITEHFCRIYLAISANRTILCFTSRSCWHTSKELYFFFFVISPSYNTFIHFLCTISHTHPIHFWKITFSSALIFSQQLLHRSDPKFDLRDRCMFGAN